MFLAANLAEEAASQPSTLALVPQIVDAVGVPVVAAGGIADGRGIAAAFALGAAGVQIGTAYLFCPEAAVSPLYRNALRQARADTTVLTDVFTGRPARRPFQSADPRARPASWGDARLPDGDAGLGAVAQKGGATGQR